MLKAIIFCTLIALFSSKDLSWLGNWFVLKSESNSLFECDPPKGQTFANITAKEKGGLEMTGTELESGSHSSWDLNWDANATVVNQTCTGVLCVSGKLYSVASIPYAEISWNITGHYLCNAILLQKPSGDEDYSEFDILSF